MERDIATISTDTSVPGELGAEIRHGLPALKALTSLRFFAAMHVVVYHLSAEHQYTALPSLGRFVMSGYTACRSSSRCFRLWWGGWGE